MSSSSSSSSAIINALDKQRKFQLGEKCHLEYGWSEDLKEKIVQFTFQIVRGVNSKTIIQKHNEILNLIYEKITSNISSSLKQEYYTFLDVMVRITLQTRDIISGKGEWNIAYNLLKSWWDFDKNRTLKIIKYFVTEIPNQENNHPYGSWKDIKAIWANFGGEKCPPELTHFIVELFTNQLKKDINSESPSLCARWVPSENGAKKSLTPFKPLYQAIACHWFSNYIETSIANNNSYILAKRKACQDFRKLVRVPLNSKLDTIQIKQCGKKYSEINYKTATSVTLRKQSYAFQNKLKNGTVRSEEEDRVIAAQNFEKFIEDGKNGKVQIKGKRVGINNMVADALSLTENECGLFTSDIDLLNLQWENAGEMIGDLSDFIAMVDTSGSMMCPDSSALNAAIGLGIRIAEKSKLGKRVLTFSAVPQWVNLDDEKTFYEKVNKIQSYGQWGMNTNFSSALQTILDAIIINKLKPEDVENITLCILSDMQIDAHGNESLNETMWQSIERKFSEAGMRIWGKPFQTPHILFWNLRATNGFPVLSDQKRATMFSGFSPVLLNMFCEKGMDSIRDYTPWKNLMNSINIERYNIRNFD